MTTENKKDAFDQWCIVELMGHQRTAGRVTEAQIGGASLLRVDVPETKARPAYTHYLAPAALYRLTPTTEAIARAVAETHQPEPVTRWEIARALPAGVDQDRGAAEDGDDDGGGY